MALKLELDECRPVDRRYGGVLRLSPPMLGALLKLPAGQEVVSAEITPEGDVDFTVEGIGLPERKIGPKYVRLTLKEETRRRVVDFHDVIEKRVTAFWESAPNESWVLFDWSCVP